MTQEEVLDILVERCFDTWFRQVRERRAGTLGPTTLSMLVPDDQVFQLIESDAIAMESVRIITVDIPLSAPESPLPTIPSLMILFRGEADLALLRDHAAWWMGGQAGLPVDDRLRRRTGMAAVHLHHRRIAEEFEPGLVPLVPDYAAETTDADQVVLATIESETLIGRDVEAEETHAPRSALSFEDWLKRTSDLLDECADED